MWINVTKPITNNSNTPPQNRASMLNLLPKLKNFSLKKLTKAQGQLK